MQEDERAVLFRDPGPCPVDDAPHTGCTAPHAPIVVTLLPQRDAAVAAALAAAGSTTPVNDAMQATLPPGQFTTAHYRGRKGARR